MNTENATKPSTDWNPHFPTARSHEISSSDSPAQNIFLPHSSIPGTVFPTSKQRAGDDKCAEMGKHEAHNGAGEAQRPAASCQAAAGEEEVKALCTRGWGGTTWNQGT